MKRDPIQARVLATKLIPNVAPDLAEQLSLRPEERSLALITADNDDVTYTALDEATKKAVCRVVYAKSCYAGADHASTRLAGEIIGILAAPNPAEAKAGLDACVDMIENVCHFVSANDEGDIVYYAHCISRTGSYLSEGAGIAEGEALAYLIAPPLEAVYGLDAALNVRAVRSAERDELRRRPADRQPGRLQGSVRSICRRGRVCGGASHRMHCGGQPVNGAARNGGDGR